MDNNLRTKDEYINSILVGLTTDFPELNKSFNENASEIYKSMGVKYVKFPKYK